MKTKGAGKVQLSLEKVTTRCTFGAKGEDKCAAFCACAQHVPRECNRFGSASGVDKLSWGKVCGKGGRRRHPPRQPGRWRRVRDLRAGPGRRKLSSKVGAVATSSYRSNSGAKRGKFGAAQAQRWPKFCTLDLGQLGTENLKENCNMEVNGTEFSLRKSGTDTIGLDHSG
jgi:hypothetical protein